MAERASGRVNGLIGVTGPRDDMPRMRVACKLFFDPESVQFAFDRMSEKLPETGGQLNGFNVTPVPVDGGVKWAVVASYISREPYRL